MGKRHSHKQATTKHTTSINTNTRRLRRHRRLPTLEINISPSSHLHCSPVAETQEHLTGSCYTADAIQQIRDGYNHHHHDESIVEQDPQQIYRRLKEKLADKCGEKEDCWLNEIPNEQVRRNLDKTLFVPDQPKDWKQKPDRWLSNFDIEAVLKQYEQAYPDFKLLGPTVLDYDAMEGGQCVDEDLCHFSLDDWIKKGKTKLAISFNLSKHDEPGTHWTTMFVDVSNKLVYYYDSALNPMPSQINKFKKLILRQGKKLGIPFQFHKNNHQHQHSNTECGMYSLFFTIVMVSGKVSSASDTVLSTKERIRLFSQMMIPDNIMKQHRAIYFNN